MSKTIQDDILKESEVSLCDMPPTERRTSRQTSEQLKITHLRRRDAMLEKKMLVNKALLSLEFATRNLKRIEEDLIILEELEKESYDEWQNSLPLEERQSK